ncbi:MAG: hypothetical protein AAF772_07205 [Acidobacteriota bacterium]
MTIDRRRRAQHGPGWLDRAHGGILCGAIVLLLTAAPKSADALDCDAPLPGPRHRAGERALGCALHGAYVPPGAAKAAGCLEVPWDAPGPGSLNWPAQCGVAEVLAGRLPPSWFHPFLGAADGDAPRAWSPPAAWEEGSIIYLPRIVIAVLVYRDRVDDPASRTLADRWLRAVWTMLALQSIPERPARWAVCSGGDCGARREGPTNYEGQIGTTWVGAGERGVLAVGPRSPVERALLGTMLAWALDRPARWQGTRRGTAWMAWEVRMLERLQRAPVGTSTSAALWGLTPAERVALDRVIAAPTDRAHVAVVLPWLAPWAPRRGSPLTLLRYRDGSLVSVRAAPGAVGRMTNGNKPGYELVITRRRDDGFASRWFSVATSRAVGAARPRVRLDADLRAVVAAADDRRVRQPLPPPRELAWVLVWDDTLDLRPPPGGGSNTR